MGALSFPEPQPRVAILEQKIFKIRHPPGCKAPFLFQFDVEDDQVDGGGLLQALHNEYQIDGRVPRPILEVVKSEGHTEYDYDVQITNAPHRSTSSESLRSFLSFSESEGQPPGPPAGSVGQGGPAELQTTMTCKGLIVVFYAFLSAFDKTFAEHSNSLTKPHGETMIFYSKTAAVIDKRLGEAIKAASKKGDDDMTQMLENK
ncbi:unnamed protein product [Vitrella brassicaformis CCMP3155]|uniref:Uncharacterized protein n=1 Tax=Vitrella brassicaformis (strain CCMP3155) TaxID=1169540 RepID=A0A0G4GKL8_VITBC|nr:unnamed protein product [Vitrella brassicaformis CCMP3155]|eukprot:CEM30565.1 unnamed protein product [Vitrella brassicaformis CCMP3155]